MTKKVEVAVIGAGSAGLYAVSQIKKLCDNFVLINSGEHGTTCARVGCMPSKVLIQSAKFFHSRKNFLANGIANSEKLQVNIPQVLQRVRYLRDKFVAGNIEDSINSLGDKNIKGKAKFIDKNTLEVNGERIKAEKIIIATGSTPVIPKSWQSFREKILTTDELFEQKDLPKSIGVIGLGPIGLEIGQALARLGIEVVGIHSKDLIGKISDEEVNKEALKVFENDFELWLGEHGEIESVGEKLLLKSGSKEKLVDKVIASLGRTPNLADLELEQIGIALDEKGIPIFDKETMKIKNSNIFIAGDVNSDRPILHEAGDEGKIAGFNAVNSVRKFSRKPAFNIIFTDPNIAFIGKKYSEVKELDIAIGTFDFSKQGRAIINGSDQGIARLYAEKNSGKILGAELFAPDAEHLAHILVLAIKENLTVYELITMPFYHPTIEEGIYLLLLDTVKKIGKKKEGLIDMDFLQ